MGGAANVAGNASPVAEANIRNDPESAYIVFHAGWPLTMVGLDVTEKTVMTPEYLEELGRANNPGPISSLGSHRTTCRSQSAGGKRLSRARLLGARLRHRSDPVRNQASLRRRRLPQPLSRWEYDPDWRGQREMEPNVNVCVDVDSERFLELYRQRLSKVQA